MKILLIEDSRTQARFITPYFDSLNPEIIWVMDAFDAWHQVCCHPDIDIIFLDAHLPFVDAELLIKKVKKEVATKDIPIVVMSSDEHAVDCMNAGASEFLKKPLREQRVLDIVKLYVKKRP